MVHIIRIRNGIDQNIMVNGVAIVDTKLCQNDIVNLLRFMCINSTYLVSLTIQSKLSKGHDVNLGIVYTIVNMH